MASSPDTNVASTAFSPRPISQFPLIVLPTRSSANHEATEGFQEREVPYGQRALPILETDHLRTAKRKSRNIKGRLGSLFRRIFRRNTKSRPLPSSLAKETSDTAVEQAFLTQGRKSPTKVLPIPPPIARMHNTVKRMLRPSKEVLLPPKPVL
jgi:hypothetical protein